jgi:hypothetical protein
VCLNLGNNSVFVSRGAIVDACLGLFFDSTGAGTRDVMRLIYNCSFMTCLQPPQPLSPNMARSEIGDLDD